MCHKLVIPMKEESYEDDARSYQALKTLLKKLSVTTLSDSYRTRTVISDSLLRKVYKNKKPDIAVRLLKSSLSWARTKDPLINSQML